MASSTSNVVTHLYDDYDQATSVVRDLEAAGVPSSDINLVANRGSDGQVVDQTSGAATGAAVGTAIGGGAGLLAGLGMMAIPGIGPVVAAGWAAATALGAAAGMAAGGMIGWLTDLGVSHEDAHVYAEGVRRGGTLLSVRTTSIPHSTIVSIMNRANPVNPVERAAVYRNEGWSKFDENANRDMIDRR